MESRSYGLIRARCRLAAAQAAASCTRAGTQCAAVSSTARAERWSSLGRSHVCRSSRKARGSRLP